jgi:hypothetical protein
MIRWRLCAWEEHRRKVSFSEVKCLILAMSLVTVTFFITQVMWFASSPLRSYYFCPLLYCLLK